RRALAELAWLRRGAYRLFASVFLYPEAQRLTELPQAAAEFRQYDSLLARLAFFAPWRRLLEALAELAATAAGGREELESEYVRLFVVGSRNVRCPLYESYYLEPGGQISGLVEAQLEREYLAGGVVVGRGLGEAPDHLAVELEFMAHLCNQEADAWEEAAAGRISIRPYSRWRSPERLPGPRARHDPGGGGAGAGATVAPNERPPRPIGRSVRRPRRSRRPPERRGAPPVGSAPRASLPGTPPDR
ncbi:MAG: molecular chaperone TorD family protein, partial [Chloroflexi bacterium]|nr:molecular chaperone TorD family protein [Chloroflexota bacterium]